MLNVHIWYHLKESGGIMKKLNMRKARDKYSEMLHEVGYLNERYIICKNTKPMAVLLSWEDWQVIEKMFKANDEKRELKE